MAFFSNLSSPFEKVDSLNPEQAFLGVIYCLIASDGLISEDEIRDLKVAILRTRFMGNTSDRAFEQLMNQLQMIYKNQGPSELLELASSHLPDDLKKAVFIICCDLSFSDGSATKDEGIMLERIQDSLKIDQVFASKAVDVITEKNSI